MGGDIVKSYLKKTFNIMLIFLILCICLGVVSAQDNTTQLVSDDAISAENIGTEVVADSENVEIVSQKIDTQINADNIDSYYKEKNTFVSYIKDVNGTPIKNKQVSIFLDGKEYKKTSDSSGKVTLALNLKPNYYKATIKYAGDENFTSAEKNSIVKIKKAPLAIKMSNFNTYYDTGRYFNVKVYNEITNNPVEGIKVLFKVYSTKTKKYTNYYATTDSKGVATLNKNLKVGTYKISVQIKDSKNKNYISYKNSGKKVTLTVKELTGEDCCSFYVQVSDTEAVGGFRRDNTGSTTITVKDSKIDGMPVVKHSNSGGFVHLIVFSNGWMAGNGGLDSGYAVSTIEHLAADMAKSNKIKMSSLKKIYRLKRSVNFGHFSIKAPNGDYAVVWKNKIITGKLKPGEFSCSPNFKEYYRHSTYGKYSSDPAKAAIKVGATDKYGVNRRQVVVLHWKASTDKNYKTTSSVKCYAANDNGKFVGVHSSGLVDNVVFKKNYCSRYKLPHVPNMKYMGIHNFGNIDKLVKTPTIVKAPEVTFKANQTHYFKVTVKDNKTKKAVSNIKVKIRVSGDQGVKWYVLKTDKNGVVKVNTKHFLVGNYDVVVSPANNKYLISAKSKIVVQ